jgi:imidazolonepropionase-like amidohydrolase
LEQLKEAYQAGILANMGMHASNHTRDSIMKVTGQESGYPFYFTSGVAATVPGGHPTQITPNIETVNDSISINQFVNHRISEGVDYIKVIKESSAWFEQPEGPPSLSYDSIGKIIEYAHSKGLKVVIHVGLLEEMEQIAKLKPDGFAHMWYSSINSDITDEQLRVIKESGAFIVPTAIVNERAILIAEKEGGPFAIWAKENFLSMSEIKNSIRRVHDAGITLLAGTDNGNFDLNWGDDLINELILYSQCGMSNIEVLKTATGNPAKAWGIPVGFLEAGEKANMLLLNGSPIEDIENLKQINTIWKNGIAQIAGHNIPSTSSGKQ